MTEGVKEDDPASVVASDLPRGVAMLADLTTSLNHTLASLTALQERIKGGELTTEKGISLLELKNQTFLSYLANLAQVTLCKLRGKKIEGSASIDRLVEQRVVLERLRPLEEKLKYQIDKHIKAATEGVVSADDPTRLKGDLDNILSSSSDDEEQHQQPGVGGKKKKKKDGEDSDDGKIYKAPKISQTKYELEEDKKKANERSRRWVLNSSMMRDALEGMTEEPEVMQIHDSVTNREGARRRRIQEYEESNLIRTQPTKKDKVAERRTDTLGTMGREMLGFTSLNPLHEDASNQPPVKRQKKSSSSLGSLGKGKGKKGKSGKGKKGFKKRGKH